MKNSPSTPHGESTGLIHIHPRGFGFVSIEDLEEEVFIPKNGINGAVDGDTVSISYTTLSAKGPEGVVLSIVKRGRDQFGATIYSIDVKKKEALALTPVLGSDRPILLEKAPPLSIGDRVIVTLTDWGGEGLPARGALKTILGSIEDPSIDILAAIHEFGLPTEFPEEVHKEALSWGTQVPKEELARRENLTHLDSVTIDPKTAKDFDDAISISKDEKGHFYLGVHIADVAHYVKPETALDKEAALRSNSTYFPGSCLPMLPHTLCDHLCSLKPNEIRLTASVLVEFSPTGDVTSYRIARSYIESRKRFSYEEAKEVLDGKLESPYKEKLHLMTELCALLKKKRSERGSIDFAMPELAIEVDPQGVPQRTLLIEYDITHQMIEEFMLKANELVAITLSKQGKSVLFRIHEEPSSENTKEFHALARTLGFFLPQNPSIPDLQNLFTLAKETPFAHQLSVSFIRSMKLACYSTENVGHFGLALEHYCHFTSPIRRYSDLIIQRLLFQEEAPDQNPEEIAKRCSDQERLSFRAEMSVKLLKKLRLLKRWVTKDNKNSFAATITKIKPFGISFEVEALALEGFLHISEIGKDYFIFQEAPDRLVGRNSGETYKLGQKIAVYPHEINLMFTVAKWSIVGNPPSSRTRRPSAPKKEKIPFKLQAKKRSSPKKSKKSSSSQKKKKKTGSSSRKKRKR